MGPAAQPGPGGPSPTRGPSASPPALWLPGGIFLPSGIALPSTERGAKRERAVCPASEGKCHLKVSEGTKKGTTLQLRLTFPCVGGKTVIQPGTHICKRGKIHVSY